MRRAADLMEHRRFDFAALMVYESAKPWHEADRDVTEAIDYMRYYAEAAERLCAPTTSGVIMGEENTYLREGRGVAAVIAPWNFPLAIITGMSAAAIAAGNAAILKPAGNRPSSRTNWYGFCGRRAFRTAWSRTPPARAA